MSMIAQHPTNNIERTNGSNTEVQFNEVKKKNEAENRTKNEPIKSAEKDPAQVEEEELVEAPSSQPVGSYLKHRINEKLIEGLVQNHRFNDSLSAARVGKMKQNTYSLLPRRPVFEAILKKNLTKEEIGGNFEIPCNIGEEVLVDVAGYVYPIEFVMLDIKEDEKRPFILGTPFLTTAKAVIKFDKGTITLRSGKSKMSFHRIPEPLCRIEKRIKNNIEPIAPTMTPKRPRNATWYKEKAMLAEAQKARQILDEEQLAFLADPRILASQARTIIPYNAAFQTEDFDTYDFDCDDLSTAQAVLMANISKYGSEVILEVPHFKTYLNDMNSQNVHALQDFEQSPVMDFTDNEISNGNLEEATVVVKAIALLRQAIGSSPAENTGTAKPESTNGDSIICCTVGGVQTPGSGISILLAVGTPSTGSGNLYCQWELSPGSGNALRILFPTVICVNSIITDVYVWCLSPFVEHGYRY
uniref:Reverse transcriptase domain-containing protein n=1 Tax=Tanacetum cinerariifolium TaxID=118510 RepID=A0A6L2L151_TANCI|nr:hypothetical protein [Tanacetum cinerariifolium]